MIPLGCYGAATEFKFAADASTGVFEGYAAVFGNRDSHGDVITPGAFADSLAQHKAAGTMPGLFVEHGPAFGGNPLPSGVWTELAEDATGLKGVGKISALNTDYGRRLQALMQDGAMKGLSIGYRVPTGGSVAGTKAAEPRRTLSKLALVEVSVVRDPSNPLARVHSVKRAVGEGFIPSLDEFKALLVGAGFSFSQAEEVAARGFKALAPPVNNDHAELKSVLAMFHDFNLSA